MCKRLGVFVFYDKDGIVDKYVEYLLEHMVVHVNRLIIVCNGKLYDKGKQILNKYSDEIYVRENTGFDAMAYKLALTEYVGWTKVIEYDEIVLFNDTFFGPLYSFSEMFEEMKNRKVDFWGITKQKEMLSKDSEFIVPEHISTYFIVFRKNVLTSKFFQNYWEQLDATQWCFSDVVAKHEVLLTKLLSMEGFTYDSYIDTKDLESNILENNYMQILFSTFELIRDKKCPIIKKKPFARKTLDMNLSQDIKNSLDFITEKLDYDVNLIWDHILRIYNITEIKNALHLEYIIPSYKKSDVINERHNTKVALFVHLYYEDLYVEYISYLKNIPNYIDLYLTVSEEIKAIKVQLLLEHYNIQYSRIIMVEPRGRDISAFFVGCREFVKDYDIVGFLHDKKTSGNKGTIMVGKSYNYALWENMLKTNEYVNNMIDLFLSNPRLGLAVPPLPYHQNYFGTIGREWTYNYEKTKKLLNRIDINVPLSEDISCFALGTTFWCRSVILDKIMKLELSYNDFISEPLPLDNTLGHWIERSLPYLAQDAGYYAATVMNEQYASLQLSNLSYMLTKIVGIHQKNQVITDINSIDNENMISFCSRYSKIFIYGAGGMALRASNILKNNNIDFECFIITDGQPKEHEKAGHKVIYLSELHDCNTSFGIIVAMMTRNRIEVLPLLKEKGYNNLYLF